MAEVDRQSRLAAASQAAKSAERRGADVVAAAEWRRYRLIEDAGRDPEELLAEGVALSVAAATLIS
jgi:hypothetical protein